MVNPQQQKDCPEWFHDAGLGLFVHWGLSSVHGGIDLSWGMIQDKPWNDDDRSIPASEYYALAEDFDPDAFEPDRWLRAAREAGMEYATMTARHHDGFAMWPSEYGDFSTADHCNERDLVGEFVAACRRQGLRVGLYYSPRDWRHPGFPQSPGPYEELSGAETAGINGDGPPAPGELEQPTVETPTVESLRRFESYFAYVKGQLEELLTRYGRIDLLWFDGFVAPEAGIQRGDGELYDLVRSAQPDIVVNDRCGSRLYGDYNTPEGNGPDRPMTRKWERAQSWSSGGWGYVEEESYKSHEWTLARVAETVARGGNLLLNVGPKGDGSMPSMVYERLNELGDWMASAEPSVKGVAAGPWPDRSALPVTRTRQGDVWYLHVHPDADAEVHLKHVPEPEAVRLLRSGESIPFTYNAEAKTLTVTHPPERRATPDDVLAVTWEPPERFTGHGSGQLQTVPE
jgi:alpha-L-fucosidase